jgi:hypothetical protein
MKWRELKEFISKKSRKDKQFLDEDIEVYDFADGTEYEVNITELITNADSEDSGWKIYLSINDKECTNENETQETSIN